jgi:hypothetical protein
MVGKDVIATGNGLGMEPNPGGVGDRAWTLEGFGKTKV